VLLGLEGVHVQHAIPFRYQCSAQAVLLLCGCGGRLHLCFHIGDMLSAQDHGKPLHCNQPAGQQTPLHCSGGVVDGARQWLAVTLAALGPREVNKVRLGALTMYTIKTLRHIKDFLGVDFDVRPDAESQTIFLRCIGSGMSNLGRRVQ
jgi:RNA 3'-terminal phosphate cyclase